MTAEKGQARSFLPLTPAVFHLLLALSDSDRHGYGIAKEVAERTDGRVRLGPGTIYGTLTRMRERQVDAQVVIISGHGSVESAVRAIKMGAFDFVEKPLSLEKTVLVVRNALRQRHLEAGDSAELFEEWPHAVVVHGARRER